MTTGSERTTTPEPAAKAEDGSATGTAPAAETLSLPSAAATLWRRLDPIHVAAAVMIAASTVWRIVVTGPGFLTVDDFPLVSQAALGGLSSEHLFSLYNNHFMPAARLLTWAVETTAGYDYRPYAVVMMAGQLAVGIAFYRLLRLLLPDTWAVLVPLALLVFNPLTLEVSAWWAVAINMLPMQLATIVAIGAQVRYMRTRRPRHLVTLGAAVVVALLFFEKALLVVAAVFLLTLCLYGPGNPVRAVLTTVRRWWQAWLTLTVICLVHLGGYLSVSASTLRGPTSAQEVGTFLQQFYGRSLTAGLLGGPWTWLDAADGPAVVTESPTAQVVSWVIIAAFVAFTVRRHRGTAGRAWVLLALYSALAAGLIAATRLGSGFSGVAGLVPRYLADVLLVAALCVGVALCGLRRVNPETAETGTAGATATGAPGTAQPAVAPPGRGGLPGGGRRGAYALAAALILLVGSSVYSGVGFAADWRDKAGRDYLAVARADLAIAEPGTVFMDHPVPEVVVPALSYPWNMQSRFFAVLDEPPVFVTKARKLSIFDDSGHIRPAWVDGVAAAPGPIPGCGYQVGQGSTDPIPLEGAVVNYWQVARIAYLSDRDTTGRFQVGEGEAVPFEVHRGLNAAFLLVLGGADEVSLTVDDPDASVCVDEIDVGALVPQPAG